MLTLPIEDDEPKSDYLDISEIKVKKPKKKKRSTRQKAADEDDIFPNTEDNGTPIDGGSMQIDEPVAQKKRSYEDASFVDDDDLQAALATQRRNALKKRQRLRPEDLVQSIREDTSATPAPEEEATGGGLVIDETSEFVANLQKPTAPSGKQRSVSRQPEAVTAMDVDSDDDEDTTMKQSYADIEDEEDLAARIKREESHGADLLDNGLEQEATLDRGIGSTLKLLQERKILKTDKDTDLNEVFRRRQLFMAERQRQEAEAERKARAQRERDRANGRLDRMSAREKEEYARQQNTLRDQQESRLLAEHFNKAYKPNVELKYVDEHGRSLTTKEAFKHMSHQFHGKGSGKQKTEKLLKKIEDEKRREAQSTLDGSQMGGMSNATVQQTKKQRQAGVRLA